MNFDDLEELLKSLIQVHSGQCSLLSMSVKNDINRLMFDLFEFISDYGTNDFASDKIIRGQYVYCYTKDSIGYLQKIQERGDEVILCASTDEQAYNFQNQIFDTYKHKYKFFIKEDCYGIDLNSFGQDVHQHPNEQECLVRLSDLDLSKTEKLRL